MLGFIAVFGSTHVVEQLSFSMIPSILTIEFDLISGSFFTFLGPNGLILGLGSKTVFGVYSCSSTNSIFYDVDLTLGSFLTFGGNNGLF